jgi:uncharacterized membrane protein (UPF0127 family)
MGSVGSRLTAIAFAVMTLCAGGAAFAGCAPGTIELRGAAGVQRFSVEIADSEAEREQGLMNRQKMPSSAGMLFVYPAPKHPYFWMKNTLIPLDMIFVDPSGRVTRVHSNAIPLDETPIDGGAGVMFVLEINGGLAKRLGIAEGDALRSPLVDQADAVWRCLSE